MSARHRPCRTSGSATRSSICPTKRRARRRDERSIWEKIILPRLGKLKLSTIDHAAIDALHRDITTIRGTPVRANRTVETLRKAFNLAIRWNWCERNPPPACAGTQRISAAAISPSPRSRALVQALNNHSEPMSVNAIKLLMLTGARRGEVLGATWAMFDLENGVWTKPSAAYQAAPSAPRAVERASASSAHRDEGGSGAKGPEPTGFSRTHMYSLGPTVNHSPTSSAPGPRSASRPA